MQYDGDGPSSGQLEKSCMDNLRVRGAVIVVVRA
jgi:hypothetical protein